MRFGNPAQLGTSSLTRRPRAQGKPQARRRRAIAALLGLVLGLAWVVGAAPAQKTAAAGAVSFGGATSVVQATPTSSVRLTKPDSATEGDLLVASFTAADAPTVITAPGGWTSVLPTKLEAGTSTSLSAYYHVVTTGDAQVSSWTWTLDATRAWSGGIARYVGVDVSRPIDTTVAVASSSSAKSTITVPGVTTTTSGTMLIGGVGADSASVSFSQPPGWAEAWDTAGGKATEHAYRPQPAAGATGAQTWTVGEARGLVGWMTALRPAPASTPAPVASFEVSQTGGTSPLAVGFTDTSTGAPTSWLWDFGDGATAATQNPSHTYTSVGNYTVSLRATNGSRSDTVTQTNAITVQATEGDVLVGAGDIADCSRTAIEDSATGALLDATPGTVFTLGDNAYPDGTDADFANCYDPAWGAVKSRTRPAAGNHEYTTSDAAPYHAYFGAAAGDPAKGWYSYDIGTDWHVVVLNSNCAFVGGCGAGSLQEQWLRTDLAASTRPCTVAMWHHPLFSSGIYGYEPITIAFWRALYEDGAELVLNGHEHDYERFAPQDVAGAADADYGIRQIIVGTGGKELREFGSVAPNSEVRDATSHGVLRLTLSKGSYSWSFLPIPGDSLDDSGTGSCHDAPSPTAPPTASFVVSPTSGSVPLPVAFGDSSAGSPTSWLWDFGDGTTSTVQSPTHTYTTPGTYTVSLKASNPNGSDTVTRSDVVTVQEKTPPPPEGATYRDTVLWDGAVGYWRLGESSGTSAADATGALPGSVVGGVTRGVAGVSGDADTAMRLDGSSGYIRVDDADALNYTTENFTVEAWAKPTTIGTTGGAVLQKGNTSGYPSWQYRLALTAAGQWRATVFVGATTFTATDTGTPSTTSWTHLVLVRSGAQLVLYVNGVAAATTTFTGSVNTSTGMLAIGRSGASSDSYFDGAVDEVAIYPTALTQAQILRHYNAATTK